MSNTAANLSHKIASASDLKGVVRTMKALAASSISQYEQSVSALADYYRTVELGLSASLRASESNISAITTNLPTNKHNNEVIGVIIFGSDQGLVGQFNEDVADFAIKTLADIGGKPLIWAVSERVYSRLADAGFNMAKGFTVPTSVNDIAGLIRNIQIDSEKYASQIESASVYVFHNQPTVGTLYQPVSQRLLPLDRQWQLTLAQIPWPTKLLPEILCSTTATVRALIREYVFISLYRACAESLASENVSRLAAMQRAEKNIDELLENLGREFNRWRQNSIDEELNDVLAGYELLAK
ncbi:F0F1 ATP synthase subunit gamma [Paraglaciecola sp. L3A3]|uniref:F0F1 ATP synthase subunit gamma n=1 Tax=Paraglaciecola sp. L3A3 TaxID=2686358 RepID=UPI00131CCB0D|nr:F0F1 ATP synthase subunit gamma [Paraglaciecola sp. L3A3]